MVQDYVDFVDTPEANTILIIDDDESNRKILGKIFSGTYEIREAPCRSVGLAEILNNKNRFCAVLLDVIMPGMDGLEVLRHLKGMGLVEKTPVFLITAESGEKMMQEAYEIGAMDIITKPVVPYVVQRRVQSVIELFRARVRLGSLVENQRAELLRQTGQIVRLNRGLIEALATVIEFRDDETGDHVKRIYDITLFMLQHTDFGRGLTEKDMENIALASILHDVGKIRIPDAVLTKPGRFTPEEYEIMKTHTVRGVELLQTIAQLKESDIYDYACDITRHHHERWDGKGYPDGLKGDEISPWAQVVSLADVYDALNSKRVYKDAYSRGKVLEMIWGGQCGAFNPRLLDSFFSVEEDLSRLYVPRKKQNEEVAADTHERQSGKSVSKAASMG